jgi:hypothetical protein
VARGEPRENLCQARRRIVNFEQRGLEVEPEVAGNLIVARPAGMQPLSGRSDAPGEPLLDGGVRVLLPARSPARRER